MENQNSDSVNSGTEHSVNETLLSPRPAPESSWYRVVPYLNRLEEVVVDSVTPAFVITGGRRRARASESEYYEPTLSAAKARLIDHHELLVSKAASMLGVRERDLEQARNPRITLNEPERDAETQ